MFESIQHIDEQILKAVHLGMANPLLDSIVVLVRNPYFWAPLYFFLLVYMYRHFGRQGIMWCIFFFITFVFCDYISASLLKPIVHRIRPCNDELLPFALREFITCGSGFSFPSTHATNHFGFAFYIIFTLRHRSKWILPLSLSWAILVCFAQLYAGVHYPSDLIAGAVLGSLLGSWNAYYFTHRFGQLV
jgi:membrane-associated phospholipid phosphatase